MCSDNNHRFCLKERFRDFNLNKQQTQSILNLSKEFATYSKIVCEIIEEINGEKNWNKHSHFFHVGNINEADTNVVSISNFESIQTKLFLKKKNQLNSEEEIQFQTQPPPETKSDQQFKNSIQTQTQSPRLEHSLLSELEMPENQKNETQHPKQVNQNDNPEPISILCLDESDCNEKEMINSSLHLSNDSLILGLNQQKSHNFTFFCNSYLVCLETGLDPFFCV